MIPIRFYTALAAAFLFLSQTAVSFSAEILRVGAAKVEITPEKPVMLGGYESRTNVSRGVHDPISARAWAFEQNGHPNNVEYTRALQAKLVELVRRALADLAPAHVGFGSGSSPVGANRREVTTDKDGKPKIILGRNPSILTDREVQVLKLTRGEK